jgi:hypothetical protein
MRSIRVSHAWTGLRATAVLAIGAIGTFGQLQALAWADDWDGDLPPAIVKARPSADVPADIPGSRTSGCRLLDSITVSQWAGRGTVAEVRPFDLMGSSAGDPCGPSGTLPLAGHTTSAPPSLDRE